MLAQIPFRGEEIQLWRAGDSNCAHMLSKCYITEVLKQKYFLCQSIKPARIEQKILK